MFYPWQVHNFFPFKIDEIVAQFEVELYIDDLYIEE